MPIRRKLAAILFADIVEYSKRIHQDETLGLDIRRKIDRIFRSCAVLHAGRVVKNLGDAAMLDFDSAVQAVSCALEMQAQMESLNAELRLAEPVHLRIGVHVGDVAEEDNDLFGNAVNIAQRVQTMAPPGGICITREVYLQIRPILKLECDPIAPAPDKPLPEHVDVLSVQRNQDYVPPPRANARPPRKRPALWAGLGVVAAVAGGLALMRPGSALDMKFEDIRAYRISRSGSSASELILAGRVKVKNRSRRPLSVKPDDFTLVVGDRKIQALEMDTSNPSGITSVYFGESTDMNTTDLLKPMEIQPDGFASGWLRFENPWVLPGSSTGTFSPDALAAQIQSASVMLQMHSENASASIDLLDSERNAIGFKERRSPLSSRVVVLETTGRVNALNMGSLLQNVKRLAEGGKQPVAVVLPRSGESVDPIVREWASRESTSREWPSRGSAPKSHSALTVSGEFFGPKYPYHTEQDAVGRLIADAPEGKSELLARLAAPEPETRAAVAQALGSRLDTEAIRALLGRLTAEQDPTARAAIMRSLENARKHPLRGEVVKAIVHAGDTSDARTRTVALDALSAMNAASNARDLALKAIQAGDPPQSALRIAGENRDARATPRLIELYSTERDPERTNAFLIALGRLRDRRVLPSLMRAARSDEHSEAAVRALGKFGDRSVVPMLVKAYHKSNWLPYQAAVLDALGDLGGQEALRHCLNVLQFGDWTIKGDAARALGNMRDPRAIPALASGAKETASRQEAMNALVRIGGPKAKAALEEIADTGDMIAQDFAKKALAKMP